MWVLGSCFPRQVFVREFWVLVEQDFDGSGESLVLGQISV